MFINVLPDSVVCVASADLVRPTRTDPIAAYCVVTKPSVVELDYPLALSTKYLPLCGLGDAGDVAGTLSRSSHGDRPERNSRHSGGEESHFVML